MRIATYPRYSSDQQSAASIEDQLRNVRAYCARQGWPAPVVYQDAAISGSRTDRPGYLRLMADCQARKFDVIVVDDLSRFGRDQAELYQAIKRLKYYGVRLVGVSDGVDTARKGGKVDVALRSLMSEMYIEDLADKTHRGLTGKALQGRNAGGLAYGYRVVTTGVLEIHPEQADVVRRIYDEFNAGSSPRAIAELLNSEGVPNSRGQAWAATSIYGDIRRHIGILANPLYMGRLIWNRTDWIKHPETGRRQPIQKPESEWILNDRPDLVILEAAVWEAAQARLKSTRARTSQTLARGRKRSGGGQLVYPLSGLLRCETCGGAMVIVDYYRYGCATRKNSGPSACTNDVKVPRAPLERTLIEQIKTDLRSPQALAYYEREVQRALKDAGPNLEVLKRRLADAERVKENLMKAIKMGVFTAGIQAELAAAENEVTEVQAELKSLSAWKPAQAVPRLKEAWGRILDTLETTQEVGPLREVIRETLGDRIYLARQEGQIVARIPEAESKITVVAGAGSVRWLTRSATIYIPVPSPDRRQV